MSRWIKIRKNVVFMLPIIKFKQKKYLPSCNGSIVCIISCNRPWRNLAPVTLPLLLCAPVPPVLEPGGPERLSEAALDVTEPPGCVAIDVSDELAALPWNKFK